MEFITVREAAEKWKISERLVQRYCAQGRVNGAEKFGVSWKVPKEAEKPADPRKPAKCSDLRPEKCEKQDVVSLPGLMPLMNTAFEPGHCMDCISEMEDSPRRMIALAEYHYFSGHAEQASEEAEGLLTCPDIDCRLSACLICAYANLSVGQINRVRNALAKMETALTEATDASPAFRAAGAFVAYTAAVLLHLPLPRDLPPPSKYLPLLPLGIRAFALYVQAHYLYLQKEYGKSLGVALATLAMGADSYPIPAIYLRMVAVMDHMSLRQPEQAEKYLLDAWNLARQDDLLECFGEHHGLLGGMLEAVIKPNWPEEFRRVISITYRFSAGWRKIHNTETGHDVADNLTTTEFATAMLAARGWTNQEIAKHMNVSVHTVKRHISTVLQKLGINHRQNLKKFMLK